MPLLRVRLSDARTGQPLAGRVAVVGEGERFVPAVGQEPTFAHNLQGGDPRVAGRYRYSHVAGQAEFAVPEGPVEVEALHGMEHAVWRRRLPRVPSRPLEIRLVRWCDPAADGWYGGEGHAHYLPPDEAEFQGAVEGLEVLAVVLQNDLVEHENVDYFRGQPPDRPRPACRVRYAEEFRTAAMHVNLYGLKRFIGYGSPVAKGVGTEATAALLEAKAQGAVTTVAHFALSAQVSLLHALAHEAVDAVEILGTSTPTRPFINERDRIPHGDRITPLDFWYRLLNLGLRLPISAGTDRMSNEMTTGAHRTYVYRPGLATFGQWARGIKAGRTFVTNGPQVRLTVNGGMPGDTVRVRRKDARLTVTACAWSQFPVDRMELIQNGHVVRSVNAKATGTKTCVTWRVPAVCSGWLALRVVEDDAAYVRQSPDYYSRWGGIVTRTGRYFATARPEPAFAHTSPVYLSVPGTVSHGAADREFFSAWVECTLAAVKCQAERSAPAVKRLAAAYREAAETLCRRLFGEGDAREG